MLSLRVLLTIYLIFCQFHLGVAYKSVTYKKNCALDQVFEAVREKQKLVQEFEMLDLVFVLQSTHVVLISHDS